MLLLYFLLFILSSIIIYKPFKYIIDICTNKSLPKYYSTNKIRLTHISDKNIRDGFTMRKIPTNIDVIIIGSGISALTNAALLSLVGKRVVVLEQHYIAGGSTHSFDDKGYEFDTGIHYIGNIEKREKMLDIITEEKIEWDKMGTKENGYVYDQIVIGDKTYYLRAGEQSLLDEINKYFPEEMDNVKKYLADIKTISKKDMFFMSKIIKNRCLAYYINKYLCRSFFKTISETAKERVEKYTQNEDLQALLLSQFGDYGQSPSEESFFLHASVVNHYLEGGWYPRGGSSEIAKNIIPIIEIKSKLNVG